MKNASAQIALSTGNKGAVSLRALVRKGWRQVQRWWELAEQRRRLAMLDEHALHDLGLSRADAIGESERPFWDDPLAGTRHDPLRGKP